MTTEPPITINEKKILLKAHVPDTWDEALAVFENDLYRRSRSDHTVTTYSYALKAFGVFYREQLKKPGPYVSRIQETDLLAYIQYLRHDRHLSATSVNRNIAALRAFAGFILVNGWHPTSTVKRG
jgi:site-specific recombinase XerD